jgi:hypothetical protein
VKKSVKEIRRKKEKEKEKERKKGREKIKFIEENKSRVVVGLPLEFHCHWKKNRWSNRRAHATPHFLTFRTLPTTLFSLFNLDLSVQSLFLIF